LRLYVLVFYTEVVGLRADLAGWATGLAILWDAVTDPVMGLVSDRTWRVLRGRRFWLPLGGGLLALGTVAVFWPPALDAQAAKFAWLLGSYCFLNTGFTVLSVPFTAMAAEMTDDPHQRSSLFGWRFVFSNLGALVAAALPQAFLADGERLAGTLPWMSLVLAGLVLATTAVSWHATAHVPFRAPPPSTGTLLGAFAAPFRSRPFRPLLLAYVVANTGIAINAATFFFYYQHVLALPETRTQTVLIVFMLVFTASILGWVGLSRSLGKVRPMVWGALVVGVGTGVLYTVVPAGGFWWVLLVGACGIGAFVGCVVLIDTIVTDVLDHDQLRTGQQRGGMYFGVWRFASKVVRAVAVGTVGSVLAGAGFVEGGASQPASVHTALVWLFGPGVGLTFVLTAVVLARYRFDDAAQQRVRGLLARRLSRSARRGG
ncbi:MAG: MFS transporter, partial [Planctomycetes bacterium]|nr:MFS transporter [Planctomycetota bacterium]